MRYYDDFDYYDDPFSEITYSCDPDLLFNVSSLRHYVNCHGITDRLLEKYKANIGQIESIVEFCRGSLKLSDVFKDYDNIIEENMDSLKKKREAEEKNRKLMAQLSDCRDNFCGLGTRKVKLFLNKKVKEGDILSKAYRIALETEDENVKAKENLYYSDYHYAKKKELINELIELCEEQDYTYGVQNTDNYSTRHIIYFELPNCEQISFHNTFKDISELPKYEKNWDGKVNSTLPKLEQAITITYKDEIDKLIEKKKEKDKK